MPVDTRLEAYRTTRFAARDGDHEAVADALLHRQAARSGVFITAWNPRSIVLPCERNKAAARRLEVRIAVEGFRSLLHRGFSAGPGCQCEEGQFVFDIDFDYAIRMATDFGLNSITAVTLGQPATLLFTPLMDLGMPIPRASIDSRICA